MCANAQAQGLWRAIQGKPRGGDAAARAAAERERREEAATEAEWAGVVGAQKGWDGRPEAPVPRTEKYDLEPYEPEDDDEYRTEEERAVAEPAAAAEVQSGAVRCPPPVNLSCSCVPSPINREDGSDVSSLRDDMLLGKTQSVARHQLCKKKD